MARLPTPVPPPVRHADRADRAQLDDLDDEQSLAKTVERKSVRITTARFTSVAPCAIDLVPAPSSSPPSSSSPAWSLASLRSLSSLSSLSSVRAALLQHPRAALGAALWLACVSAGITGVLIGHTRSPRAHATATLATHAVRAPRAAVVVEANEEITQPPILAPGKVVDSVIDSPLEPRLAEAIPAPARPLRRQGFGHLGADRVASGAAVRRAAPHRH